MIWVAAIVIIILIVILNYNIIVLNKNFMTFYNRFISYIKALVEFLSVIPSWFKAPTLDRANHTDQSFTKIPIARGAHFIQRYRIFEDAQTPDDTAEILDMSWYDKYNLVMLEVWITPQFLKTIIELSEETELNEAELFRLVPPVACANADIYETIDKSTGEIVYSVDYNTELIIIDLEDDDNDIYQ